MARRHVADIRPGEFIEAETFLVAAKDLRTTTAGSLYIHAVLADRTGQMVARIWQASEAMYKTIPEGGFINVKGRSESYKGNLQFIIEAIRPVDTSAIDFGDFLPATERDVEEMWQRTKAILGEIKDSSIHAVVQEFLKDEDRMAGFKRAPAARKLHHACVGGLIEHTLNVLELGKLILPRYPRLNADLVLAGLFLHDLGKIAELAVESHFQYTDQGQLLGHISICVIWIEQAAERVAKASGKPFPEPIKLALQHIVISHHSRPEFGSPKHPAFPEALAVHYLDNLDAKLEMSINAIDQDIDDTSRWTAFHHALETKLYKPNVSATES